MYRCIDKEGVIYYYNVIHRLIMEFFFRHKVKNCYEQKLQYIKVNPFVSISPLKVNKALLISTLQFKK